MTQTDAPPAEIARIHAKLRTGDVDGAADLAREAYIDGVVDPLVLNLVAHRLEERGEIEEALKLLHEALELSPEDAGVYANIGHCLLKLARPTHALEAFNRALKIDANLPRAHHGAGLALAGLGDIAAGEDAQIRAARMDPRYAAPVGALALSSYEKRDFERAEAFSAEALRRDPNESSALIVKGSLLWNRGEVEACADLLGRVLSTVPLAPLHRSAVERQYADTLDRQGRYDEAFAGYETANALLRRVYADRFDASDVESMSATCDRLLAYFEDYAGPQTRSAPPRPAGGPREHVFLLGFPRSGTTLLEQLLAGHPEIEALEEMPTAEDAIQHYFFQPGGIERLMAAPESELDAWRANYWDKVRSYGLDVRGKVFIDKGPSLTLYIPLLLRLFPDAKILFCVRDPRDVVFGCFRRTFRMNATVFEYTTLASLADFYAKTMTLGQTYIAKLSPALHLHKHEALVADVDTELEALCRFLGVEVDPAMRDVAATASRRDVRTPSARQIREGLNASGVKYWTNYRRHLEAILPVLEPWALAFGYDSAFAGAESEPAA